MNFLDTKVNPNCILFSQRERERESLKSSREGGGRVVRRCWVNFQGRGVLLIWIIVGIRLIALAVGAGEGCLDIFSLVYFFFSFSLSGRWSDTDGNTVSKEHITNQIQS